MTPQKFIRLPLTRVVLVLTVLSVLLIAQAGLVLYGHYERHQERLELAKYAKITHFYAQQLQALNALGVWTDIVERGKKAQAEVAEATK